MTIKYHTAKTPARRPQGAFTLVELLLVMTILAILAGIVLPKLAGRGEEARISAAKTQISTLGTALGAYEVDNGGYPRGQTGLSALMVKPRDAMNCAHQLNSRLSRSSGPPCGKTTSGRFCAARPGGSVR